MSNLQQLIRFWWWSGSRCGSWNFKRNFGNPPSSGPKLCEQLYDNKRSLYV